MKALTIRQPYAAAIFDGRKTVENRTWTPKVTRQQIAVHAAAAPAKTASTWSDQPVFEGTELERVRSAVLGTAWLAVTHLAGSAECDCEATESGAAWPNTEHPVIWHWIIDDVVLFAAPIPARGRLGLWTVDAALKQAIADAPRSDAIRVRCPSCWSMVPAGEGLRWYDLHVRRMHPETEGAR